MERYSIEHCIDLRLAILREVRKISEIGFVRDKHFGKLPTDDFSKEPRREVSDVGEPPL